MEALGPQNKREKAKTLTDSLVSYLSTVGSQEFIVAIEVLGANRSFQRAESSERVFISGKS